MCGIAGFLTNPGSTSEQDLLQIAVQMGSVLRHRGPDDEGQWADAAAGVALAHRRLSIIDLSAAGHQPMQSACGRYVIVYNGEVYNHRQLRDELDGAYPFRGHSDTEVLLAAIAQWGLVKAIERAVGMFALALWDRQERRLWLVRDRVGIKPLYYGWQNGVFLFASELKALRQHPAFQGQIDRTALSLFLRYSYIPCPHSIYEGIYKLPPGTMLSVRPGDGPQSERHTCYWDAAGIARRGAESPFRGTVADAIDALDQTLREAVRLRMYADVDLGAFLSGGIDSSTVVALMQAQSNRAVKTFSIGFHEDEYNEAKYAAAVARHLKTDHTEWYVSAAEAQAVIPRLPEMYDEPFGDSSQIPTYLVSQLARRHVTVSLSGDGGDELFGGYPRYWVTRRRWRKLVWCPLAWRKRLSRAVESAARVTPWPRAARKLDRLADRIAVATPDRLYARTIEHWNWAERIVIGAEQPCTLHTDVERWQVRDNLLEQLMYLDLMTYLPDDILVKVDRASMAVSLEARVPILDHRVVELAWQFPVEWKIRGRTSKWLLRQVLRRYVPDRLIDRPKAGFSLPIDHWLRGDYREWAEELLDPARLRREGFLRPEPIRQKWEEHLAGTSNWHFQLWDVLMFQTWLEHQRSGCPAAA